MGKKDEAKYNSIIAYWINEAEKRESVIPARNLIHHFIDCFKSGHLPNYELMKFISDGFEAYLNGSNKITLEQTMCLKVARGKTSKNQIDAMDIYFEFERMRAENISYDDCLNRLADMHHKSEEAISTVLKNMREVFDAEHIRQSYKHEFENIPDSKKD